MDSLLIVWQKLSIYRFGISPNKIMDYMMAAKPIIHSNSAGNDPVAENDCGISVPAEDASLLANAIERLMNMSALEHAEMGRKGQKYVMNNHDYSVLAEKYLQIMKK